MSISEGPTWGVGRRVTSQSIEDCLGLVFLSEKLEQMTFSGVHISYELQSILLVIYNLENQLEISCVRKGGGGCGLKK